MPTPGSNILRKAQRLIKFQNVSYYEFLSRTQNAARQWVPSFNAPTNLRASVQAVDRMRYAQMGLDFNKFYVRIFASLNIIDLQRDSSGDRFIYNGDLYQMEDGQSWFAQDGWATALAIRIKTGATGPV